MQYSRQQKEPHPEKTQETVCNDKMPLRALVVEDVKLVQKVHQEYLKTLGYKVDIAGSGYEALELAAQSDYHCALLDVGLPDISGESVLSAIRHREQKTGKRRLPIIVNSAAADDTIFQRCRENGADATLQKPVALEDLSRVLLSLSQTEANGSQTEEQ